MTHPLRTLRRQLRHPLDALVLLAVLLGLAGLWGLGWHVGHELQAATPPPVNLGQAGLTVEIGLDAYDAQADTWTAADASAITVTDQGDGDYQLAGLPAASGRDRYRVTVALTSDPDRDLVQMIYGALPGGQVLWMPRVTIPSQPLVFVEGDSSGTLGLTISSGLPQAITDPGTTVTLDLVPVLGGAALLDGAAATIASTWEDATTGAYGAELVYTLGAGDLPAGSAGDYRAYWTITWPTDPATQRTLPPRGVPVEIEQAPGA